MSPSRARMRKLTAHDRLTNVVRIDILTGHEEIGNLHFDPKTMFHGIFIEKNYAFSQNLYS